MSSVETEANEETGAEAYTTVTENHFGTAYTSVSREKSFGYTTGNNTAEYSYQTTGTDEDEKLSADTVKYNDSVILSSAYTYDDNGNVLSKSYGESNIFTNTYDDKDRIISTSYAGKTYYYTYDTDSQLTGVTGNNYTASYEYDSRGNITSKTVNDETTTFTYANSGWKDLLVSVNGTELTYDANGNVLTYGDREYSWTNGRNLAQITDGDSTYSYTYDENGIRTSKTVNGVTTYFNTKDGVILSQTDGTNTMYFQYNTSGAPLGFIYNGTQYFYMTNQMGDVIAITDTAGTVVANYEYDAWGKVLTADTSIAQQNPLRYRGYYYDNETGYYYLQSRYYDPSICRFINSDIAEIAGMSKGISAGTNLFAYCNNDPVNFSDPTGFWVIKRTTLETLLDVMLAICASGMAAPMDIAGKAIKRVFGKTKTYKAVSKVVNHLTNGVVPKFKGLFSKFFTKIRTAIWRVTGHYISSKANGIVLSVANRFINVLTGSKFSVQIDMIFCMFSASGWVAMFMDLLDGKFDNKVHI